MAKWINLNKEQSDQFGTGTVAYKHRLRESGLFEDDRLAELIERTPREHYMITSMNHTSMNHTSMNHASRSHEGEKTIWRNGDFGRLSGHEVLSAIKNGRLWLALRNFDQFAPEYQELIGEAVSEINADLRSGSIDRKQAQLLISSPGARVFYHTDIPLVNLWHIRGKKRFYLWDAENKTFLPDQQLEGVILRRTEEEIAYDPSWDKDARIFDLEPGDGITWPHNGPHKVDNLHGLNVSISMEYFTAKAKRKYGVYYTNGLMRRYLGMTPKHTSAHGVTALTKCAIALAVKKSGLTRRAERNMMQSFVLDPANIGSTIDLPPALQRPIIQA